MYKTWRWGNVIQLLMGSAQTGVAQSVTSKEKKATEMQQMKVVTKIYEGECHECEKKSL